MCNFPVDDFFKVKDLFRQLMEAVNITSLFNSQDCLSVELNNKILIFTKQVHSTLCMF